jgi:hypothetical protein
MKSAASPLPTIGFAPLGGASWSAQIDSRAKCERKKDERPRRKPRSVERGAFPPAAISVMITSSFSIAFCVPLLFPLPLD